MSLALEVQSREITGKKVEDLREQGVVPAVVYGKGMENMNIQLQRSEITKMLPEMSKGCAMTLTLDGKAMDVVLQDIEFHAVSGFVTHVDFKKA
jgi:large subunit ribosomal protein L25